LASFYPTTILFPHAIQHSAGRLSAGQQADASASVKFKQFLDTIDFKHWEDIEDRFATKKKENW